MSEDNIINLADERPGDWINGDAMCMLCHHEFYAVSIPGGITFFECEKCHAHKAYFKFHVQNIKEDAYWRCHCGNNLFLISEEYILCPNCGMKQEELK